MLVASSDREALHQMRVALRRLRSALWLFKPILKDARSKAIRHGLRDFANALGAARDVDVCLARSSRGSRERRWLKEQRTRAYETLFEELHSSRSRRLLSEIAAWTEAGDWRNSEEAKLSLLHPAIKRIDRLWHKILKFGPDPATLGRLSRHRLRAQVKKLRYSLEFLERSLHRADRERKKFRLGTEALQTALGTLNDLKTCGDLRTSAGLRPKRHRAAKRKHFRRARRSLQRLNRIGQYWHIE